MLNRNDCKIYGVGANAKIPDIDGLKAKAEYAMNAGSNNNTDTKYAGNVGIADLSVMKIGAAYKPSFSDKLSANLDHLIFKENEVASGSDKIPTTPTATIR